VGKRSAFNEGEAWGRAALRCDNATPILIYAVAAACAGRGRDPVDRPLLREPRHAAPEIGDPTSASTTGSTPRYKEQLQARLPVITRSNCRLGSPLLQGATAGSAPRYYKAHQRLHDRRAVAEGDPLPLLPLLDVLGRRDLSQQRSKETHWHSADRLLAPLDALDAGYHGWVLDLRYEEGERYCGYCEYYRAIVSVLLRVLQGDRQPVIASITGRSSAAHLDAEAWPSARSACNRTVWEKDIGAQVRRCAGAQVRGEAG